MENIKELIKSRYKTFSLVTIAIMFSVFALMVRIKLTKSYFYLFLVWNVFLAIIPYAITIYLNTKPKNSKLMFCFWFFVWLFFLPNAPYIITDLIHLRLSNDSLLFYDLLVILSFALTGLLLYYFSVFDMQKLLRANFKRLPVNTVLLIIFFLSGFGVYLGRVLRFNSWEIISNPQVLCLEILEIVTSPIYHNDAWLFTMSFSVFLGVGYWIIKTLNQND